MAWTVRVASEHGAMCTKEWAKVSQMDSNSDVRWRAHTLSVGGRKVCVQG